LSGRRKLAAVNLSIVLPSWDRATRVRIDLSQRLTPRCRKKP